MKIITAKCGKKNKCDQVKIKCQVHQLQRLKNK